MARHYAIFVRPLPAEDQFEFLPAHLCIPQTHNHFCRGSYAGRSWYYWPFSSVILAASEHDCPRNQRPLSFSMSPILAAFLTRLSLYVNAFPIKFVLIKRVPLRLKKGSILVVFCSYLRYRLSEAQFLFQL